jgi:hypothetical protein
MSRKLLPSLVTAVSLSMLGALSMGCTETVVVHERGHRSTDVPFRGMYAKFGEATFKNGQRIRVANANGAATVRVEPGKVTYDQTYLSGGMLKRVAQLYTFRARDVRTFDNGDFEVVLTFQRMDGDTSGYSPDRNNPRLEAHRVGSGWQIDLFTTDNNGVVGILECR